MRIGEGREGRGVSWDRRFRAAAGFSGWFPGLGVGVGNASIINPGRAVWAVWLMVYYFLGNHSALLAVGIPVGSLT